MSTASLAPPLGLLPLEWPRQEALLERQHDRLEALLADLVDRHCLAERERSAVEAEADTRDCMRLLRGLRLHLRLEERWLAQRGCLCPAHRGAHRDAAELASSGWQLSATQRAARLPWLMDLQQWFHGHRRGPDAIAYARAATSSSTSISSL
jgi:hypothetical protein